MGMYSTYVTQDIEVKNKEALKEIEKKFDTMNLIDENGEIDFCEWDSHKLEGYWYKETREILKAIAEHIEGYTEFTYEEGYNFRILFENKKVYYQRAENKWLGKEEIE